MSADATPPGDVPFRDVAGRPKGPLDGGAWDARWIDGNTPWDLGDASPPFRSAIAEGLVGATGRALVPGCGAGHDARLLASTGFDVTGVDLSPNAAAHARQLAEDTGVAMDVRVADLFALPEELTEFDLVLEHTCFCAIDPTRRDDYVRAVADALRPGGRLLGLFFTIEVEEGPPFGATEAEIRHRFGARFTIDIARVPTDSIAPRLGREMLFLMTRNA